MSSLTEGEWAATDSQSGITQGMRRMTARQTKKIEKESENLFVYVECSSVKDAASRFSIRINVTKKRKKGRMKESKQREWHLDGLIFLVQVLSVFYLEAPCSTLYSLYITL